jgi:mono/diheme cytochrome c family protein
VSGRRLAAAATLILPLCGCGGHRQTHAASALPGRAVFAAACAGCHTVTGHDTRARGGDLGIAQLSAGDVASFVRVMPVHLSARQVAAVAAYVHAAAVAERGRH